MHILPIRTPSTNNGRHQLSTILNNKPDAMSWRCDSKAAFGVCLWVAVCFVLMYVYNFVPLKTDAKFQHNGIGKDKVRETNVAMQPNRKSRANSERTTTDTTVQDVTSEIWRKLMRPRAKKSFRESVDHHYSQSHQDQTVYDIFPQKNGFFIEMGAYDGKVHSNTLWLERKHNWTGLLIEGNPKSCRSIDVLHRQVWRLCACVSNEKEASFIMGNEVGGIGKHMPKSHLVHLNSFQKVQIPCFNLRDVLEILGVFHVNYFSLDVEGGEMHVLNSMKEDLVSRKIIVDVWTIEYRAWAGQKFDWQKGKENLANLRAFFKEVGGYIEHSQLAYERQSLPDGHYLDVVFVYIETWCKHNGMLPGGKIKC